MAVAASLLAVAAGTEAIGGAPASQPAAQGQRGNPAEPRTWLERVVVTATRGEMAQFLAPYTVDVVDLEDFSTRRLYRSIPEALADTPGVMVQRTSSAQGSPYIRGFTGFRTLMLVDGVRINNSAFRDGPNQYWNTVDPYAVDRLEVVKGPSSVLYGSDAVGGTVNAITRSYEPTGDGFGWSRQVFVRAATADRSIVTRGEVGAGWPNLLSVLAGGTWKDYGDIDGGRSVGPQDRTGYGECSGDVKVRYSLGRDAAITGAHYNFHQDDAWRTHKTVYGLSWHGTTVGNERAQILDQHHTLTYLRYEHKNLGGFIDAMRVTFSHQLQAEGQWRIRADGRSDKQGFSVDTYGLEVQLQSPSPIGRWTYGWEWYHDDVRSFLDRYRADGSFQRRDVQGPVADDAAYDLMGTYVQDQIPLADRLELILGGRHTYARADASKVMSPTTGEAFSLREDWSSVVGSARLSWLVDPGEHVNLFGGVSQGFRAPNLSDLTRFDTARTNEIETPSPGLEPERFLSYEAGVKGRWDRFAAQAAWFYTDIRDMIVRAPTGNIIEGNREVIKRNAGNGWLQGAEVEARYRFGPQWTAFGAFTWVYGEVRDYPTSDPVQVSEPISRLMPPTGQVGVRWDHPDRKVWAEAVCDFAGKADKLSAADREDTQRIPPGGTPGYTVLSLRGGWKIQDGLSVWAALENLTNRDYRIHGSGVNQPGITLRVGLQWRF